MILDLHRRAVYPEVYEESDPAEELYEKEALYRKTGKSPRIVVLALTIVLGLLLAGCILISFTFT